MKNIACAILAVGMMFYVAYNKQANGAFDIGAAILATIAAIAVFLIT